ncbi:MAG: TetR/AcrR family transcriptional regulator [Bacteroidota bacterium]
MPRTEVFDREEVLERAKHTFWLKGYNGTSMQDLVDAMGLNRSSIYNSFGSKGELYELTLQKYRSEAAQWRQKVFDKEKTAIETIGLLFLYGMQDILRDTENKGCMMINCSTELGNQDEGIQGICTKNQEDFVASLDELVQRGQKEGNIRDDEKSLVLAHYLVTAFNGFRITGLNIKDEKVLKGIIQNVLKTIT